jgi:cysteine synthase
LKYRALCEGAKAEQAMSITWLSEPWGARLGGISSLIHETRLVALKSFPGVWLKCEHENPSGSHKDRAYVSMLAGAEGLDDVSTLVDYTTGNGGISLAWIAQQLGKQAVVFMPEGMTNERADLIRQWGARLFTTPRNDFIRGARAAAEAFVRGRKDCLLINQSDNLSNERAYIAVGDEIVAQCKKRRIKPAAFVCGIGTGGAFSGISFALKSRLGQLPCIAIEVDEAPVIWAKRAGHEVRPSLPSIIGFGPGVIAMNTDERLVDEVEVVGGRAVEHVRAELDREGFSVGPSTAANVFVANQRARALAAPVVTISFDRGDRYP